MKFKGFYYEGTLQKSSQRFYHIGTEKKMLFISNERDKPITVYKYYIILVHVIVINYYFLGNFDLAVKNAGLFGRPVIIYRKRGYTWQE